MNQVHPVATELELPTAGLLSILITQEVSAGHIAMCDNHRLRAPIEGSYMTLPVNQIEESPNISVRLASSDLQLTESEPPPANRFELTFCGVLVVLIFAIIGVLFAVAL